MVQHQIDRILRVRIQTVALKYIPSEVTLERGEAELIVSVALQPASLAAPFPRGNAAEAASSGEAKAKGGVEP